MTPSHRVEHSLFQLSCLLGLVLTAFPLVVNAEAWDRFAAWSVAWAITPPPAPTSALSDLLTAPFFLLRHFSYMTGTALLFWCGGWWLLRREKQLIPAEIAILLLCNFYVVAQALPLLLLPNGASVRAMGGDLFVFLTALGLTAFGLTGGTAELCRGRPRPAFVIRAVLSLLPVPLMFLAHILISGIKGFVPR